MAYTITQPPNSGLMPIANTDIGVTPASSATLIPSPPMKLGMVVRAVDPTYGEGEFICLYGVASLAVGSLVTYNEITGLTTICPTTTFLGQPVAVSMSANTSTTLVSWFQIGGTALIKKGTTVTTASAVAVFMSGTGGQITVTARSGQQVLNARFQGGASVASTTATMAVLIQRPFLRGQFS